MMTTSLSFWKVSETKILVQQRFNHVHHLLMSTIDPLIANLYTHYYSCRLVRISQISYLRVNCTGTRAKLALNRLRLFMVDPGRIGNPTASMSGDSNYRDVSCCLTGQ